MYRVLYKDSFSCFLACQYVLHCVCLLIALIKTIISVLHCSRTVQQTFPNRADEGDQIVL